MSLARTIPGVLLAPLLLSSAAGCGGCVQGPSDVDDGEVFPELAPEVEAMLGALCDYQERCPSDYYAIGYRDREECIHILYFLLTCRFIVEEDAYENNVFRVEHHDFTQTPDQLLACRDWIEDAACDAWGEANAGPCGVLGALFAVDDDDDDDDGNDDDDIYRMPVGEGESCEGSVSCQEPLRCRDRNDYDGVPEEEVDYCSTCLAPVALGEDCLTPPHFCRYDEEVQHFCSEVTGLCTAPLGAGDACAEQNVPCALEYYCDETSGVCTQRLALGDACDRYDHNCGADLHCSIDLLVCTGPEPDGATCSSSDDCASEFCNRRLAANYDGLCDPAGFEGDPCVNDYDCRDPGDCNLQIDMCIVKRWDGEPCVRDFQCYDGYCDPTTSLCGKRANGEPCTEDRQCDSGTCDLASLLCGLQDGAPCDRDQDCQSLSCDSYSDTCEALRELGSYCTWDDDCASHLCDDDNTCRLRCVTADDCQPGEYCSWSSSACRPLGVDGASCDFDEDCVSGWCSLNGRCGHPPEIGDPCTDSMDCYPRGYCSGGVCQAKLGPGKACDSYDSCLEPYVCLGGRCKRFRLECAPAAAGEMCTYLWVCEEGLYCDPMAEFTCRTSKREGQDCMLDWECQQGLLCTSSTCSRAPAPGDPCTSGCEPALWCDSDVDPPVCRERRADGGPCDRDEQCIDDYCYDGYCGFGSQPPCVMP